MADKITNLNLQIPNRNQIIYTSDTRAIGSMSSAKNVDNTNSTYLRNRIEGTNEIKINNKTIKRKLINTSSDGTDNGSYEGAGRICYGDSGDLVNITYKDNNTWSEVSSDLKSLAPNKYGYNIAYTLVDVDMYKDMYANNTYNTNSWHLESWNNVPYDPNTPGVTLKFTRGIKENLIDWTKPVRFYYGNINAEKLYSRNAFSKFNAKLLHIYISDAQGNYKSAALESFDKNNSKIILHYYNKNNRIMRYEQNITRPTNTTVWCNMLVIIPEDCYQIEGIEFKLYTEVPGTTNYTNEVEATVEISNFNINVWGLEEFVTKYITQELIIQRLKTGDVYKNCDIFNQPLLFNNSMRYDLKMSNSPCPKFNSNTYIEFNNDSLRAKEFTSVSFYYKSNSDEEIEDGSYIIGTNLLSAVAEAEKDSDGNTTNYKAYTDNVIVLTKEPDTYTLKVFFQNTDDNTDSTKFYNITDYFKTGVGIKFDISKTMLRINDNIVQADNTVRTFKDYDESILLLLATINDSSVLGSLGKNLTLPGCYYDFKLHTETTSTNSVCLHLPMEEGDGDTVIDVSDTSVNINTVKYFTISNLGTNGWGSQDDIFYNTTEGYYTNINDDSINEDFNSIKYFPKINDSVAKNFKYVYDSLEHGINCGDIKLSSSEILENGKEVIIDNSNKLFSKTISELPIITDDSALLTLNPKYTFDIFDTSSDISEGLWHIYGTINFGLPEVNDGTQKLQIDADGLVKSTYTGTIGDANGDTVLTLFEYENNFTDSLTIDQYYYGSFKTSDTLTIKINLTTLNSGGNFTNGITAITAINLTVDKLYFEDDIIASYRYDIDNADSEYYSGSYYITKYSSESQNTDVKSLYFNNSSSDEIMTYDNTFDTISNDLLKGEISTTVYCNDQNVGSNGYTITDMSDSKISFYSSFSASNEIDEFTYTTSVESGNSNNIIELTGNNTSTPTITRNNIDAGLNGGTVTFTTTTKLNDTVYGFGNDKTATNNWKIDYTPISENVTSNFDLKRTTVIGGTSSEESLLYKDTGLIRPETEGTVSYNLSLNLNSNYTFKSVSAKNNGASLSGDFISDEDPHNATCSTDSITSYANKFDVIYQTNANSSNVKSITNTYNFKTVSGLTYYFNVTRIESENNNNYIYSITLTIPNTYDYLFDEDLITGNNDNNSFDSDTEFDIKSTSNTCTISWLHTLYKGEDLNINLTLTPSNILPNVATLNLSKLTCTYQYKGLDINSPIYFVDGSDSGSDTLTDGTINTGTNPTTPAKTLSDVLQYAATYSRKNKTEVTIYVKNSTDYDIKDLQDIILDSNINIIGCSDFGSGYNINTGKFTKEPTKEYTTITKKYDDTGDNDDIDGSLPTNIFVFTAASGKSINVTFEYIKFNQIYAGEHIILVKANYNLNLLDCIFNECGTIAYSGLNYATIHVGKQLKMERCTTNGNATNKHMTFNAKQFNIQSSIFDFSTDKFTDKQDHIFCLRPYAYDSIREYIIFNNNYVIIKNVDVRIELFEIVITEESKTTYKPIKLFNYNTIIGTANAFVNFIKISQYSTKRILLSISSTNIRNSYFKNIEFRLYGTEYTTYTDITFENCVFTNNPFKYEFINCIYLDSTGKDGIEYTESARVYKISLPSQLPGNAIPIDITKDIDGKPRSTTNPTIGAVEYLVKNENDILEPLGELTKGLYIDLDSGNDNYSGLSWVSPKKTFKTNLDKVFADASFAKRYVSEDKKTINIYVTSGTEKLTTNVNGNLKSCDYKIIITGGYNATNDFTLGKPVDDAYATINGGGTFENNKFTNLVTRRLLHSDDKINVNSITFNNFIFTNFCNKEAGNIIYINNGSTILDNLTFNNCKFLDNYNNIAKIYLKANSGNIKDVSFNQCDFINNISSDYAGVLVFDGPTTGNNSTLTIYGCTFEKCYAGYNSIYDSAESSGVDSGGVYYTTYAPKNITIEESDFDNCCTYDGGGSLCIYHDNITSYEDNLSNLTISNCKFTNNYSANEGGAIVLYNTNKTDYNTSIKIKNCVFDNNSSNSTGGAIFYREENLYKTDNTKLYSELTIENCVFSNNHANSDGGAVYALNYENTITTINSIFYNNTTDTNGGAWYDRSINNDHADERGYNKTKFYYCTFNKNHANNYGGALHSSSWRGYQHIYLDNNIFWDNRAVLGGSNLYYANSNVTYVYTDSSSQTNIINNPEETIIYDSQLLGGTDLRNYCITDHPHIVPYLHDYNNNITGSTNLPSLPLCYNSSAFNKGKLLSKIEYVKPFTETNSTFNPSPYTSNDNEAKVTLYDIRGAERSTTNPTIGACEYLNRSNKEEFTGICITSEDENDYKVLLDENATFNVYYPDLTAEAEDKLNEEIKITQTPPVIE